MNTSQGVARSLTPRWLRRWMCWHGTTRSVSDVWGKATTCDECGQAWVEWSRTPEQLLAEYERRQATGQQYVPLSVREYGQEAVDRWNAGWSYDEIREWMAKSG